MAAKSEESQSAKAKPGASDQDIMTMTELGFGNMSKLSTAWVEAFSDMGSEVISFVADRIREDVKTQHRILHCKDMTELQHIQAEFIQRAIDQYTAETGKLVEMSGGLFKMPGEGKE